MMTRQEYHKLADEILAAFQVYSSLEDYRTPEAGRAYETAVEAFDKFKNAAKEGVEMTDNNENTASGGTWVGPNTAGEIPQGMTPHLIYPSTVIDPRTNTPWVNVREMETKIASLETQVKELEDQVYNLSLDLRDEHLLKLFWKAKSRKLKSRLLAEKLAQALNAERESRQEYEAEDARWKESLGDV